MFVFISRLMPTTYFDKLFNIPPYRYIYINVIWLAIPNILKNKVFTWKVLDLTLWVLLFRKFKAENLIKAPNTAPKY